MADDEQAAIEDGADFQIVWSYTIDGSPYLVPERIRVERYSVVPWCGPDYVLQGHPSLAKRIGDGSAGAARLADALAISTEEVVGELEAAGVRAEYYRPTTVGKIAVRYLALHYLFMQLGGDEDLRHADTYRERFKAQIHQMIQGRPFDARLVSRQDDTSKPAAGHLAIFRET